MGYTTLQNYVHSHIQDVHIKYRSASVDKFGFYQHMEIQYDFVLMIYIYMSVTVPF